MVTLFYIMCILTIRCAQMTLHLAIEVLIEDRESFCEPCHHGVLQLDRNEHNPAQAALCQCSECARTTEGAN